MLRVSRITKTSTSDKLKPDVQVIGYPTVQGKLMRLNTLIPDHIVYMSLIGERVAEQKDILKPLPLLGS